MPAIEATREWYQPNRYQNAQQNVDAPAESSHPRPPFITFSFYLSSTSSRDRVIAATARIRELTVLSIFGCGGSTPVYVRPVYPKVIYDLLTKARAACTSLGYLRPVVRNLRIFVRPTFNSELLPILCEEDLYLLPPNQNQNRSANLSLNAITPTRGSRPFIPRKSQRLQHPQSNQHQYPHQLPLLLQYQQAQQPPQQQQQQPPQRQQQQEPQHSQQLLQHPPPQLSQQLHQQPPSLQQQYHQPQTFYAQPQHQPLEQPQLPHLQATHQQKCL
ncbi:myb-like protein AA [Phymastichus coffea]|uniref:myb-like protein AA n=1 Tax=Phymastichus coffea TaxID=108790 RepID=UPI00273A91D5|nr:myb-like protein AA [Phymastichus coffea]